MVGCGDIGNRVARALHQQGHQVTGLKRRPLDTPQPFPVICCDIRSAESLSHLGKDFDYVVFIVSAGSRQAEAYQALYGTGLDNLLDHFAQVEKPPRWLMVSSTSVYGQQQGEWVDENSPTQPQSASSQWLLAAEQRIGAANPLNCVVRFSGIYGPGRDWLLRRSAQAEAIQQQPPSYTNRIHRDDCVAVLLFLLDKMQTGENLQSCYLASDNDPAPLWDVMCWIASQYSHPAASGLILSSDAPQNKRCSNARLRALGYEFLYPGYREGYRSRCVLNATT